MNGVTSRRRLQTLAAGRLRCRDILGLFFDPGTRRFGTV